MPDDPAILDTFAFYALKPPEKLAVKHYKQLNEF